MAQLLLDAHYLFYTDVTMTTPAVSLYVARDGASVRRAIRGRANERLHPATTSGVHASAAFFLVTVNTVDLSRCELDDVEGGVVVVTVQPSVSSVRHAIVAIEYRGDGRSGSRSNSRQQQLTSSLHSLRSSLVTEIEHCPVSLRAGQQVAAFLLLRCRCVLPPSALGALMLHASWLGDHSTLAALTTHTLGLYELVPHLFKSPPQQQQQPLPYKLSALRSSNSSQGSDHTAASFSLSFEGIGVPPRNIPLRVLVLCSDVYDPRRDDEATRAHHGSSSPDLPAGPITSATFSRPAGQNGLNSSITGPLRGSQQPPHAPPMTLSFAILSVLQSLQEGDMVACVCGEDIVIPPTTTVPPGGGRGIPLVEPRRVPPANSTRPGGNERRLQEEALWLRAQDVLSAWESSDAALSAGGARPSSNNSVLASTVVLVLTDLGGGGGRGGDGLSSFSAAHFVRRNSLFYHTTIASHAIDNQQHNRDPAETVTASFDVACEGLGGLHVSHSETELRSNIGLSLARQRQLCAQSATSIFVVSASAASRREQQQHQPPRPVNITSSSTYLPVRDLPKISARCVHHGRIASRESTHAVFELADEAAMDGSLCISLVERALWYSSSFNSAPTASTSPAAPYYYASSCATTVDMKVIHANRVARVEDAATTPLALSWWIAAGTLRSILVPSQIPPHFAGVSIDRAWIAVAERVRLHAPLFFDSIAETLKQATSLKDVKCLLLEGLSNLYVIPAATSMSVERLPPHSFGATSEDVTAAGVYNRNVKITRQQQVDQRPDGLLESHYMSMTQGGGVGMMSSIIAANPLDATRHDTAADHVHHHQRLPEVVSGSHGGPRVIPVSLGVTTNEGRPQVVSGALRGSGQHERSSDRHDNHIMSHHSSDVMRHYSDPHVSTFDVSTDDDEVEDRSQHQPTLRHSAAQKQPQEISHQEERPASAAAVHRAGQPEARRDLSRNSTQQQSQQQRDFGDHDVVATVHVGPQAPLPSAAFYNDDMKEHVMADPRWLALQLPLSSSSSTGKSSVASSPFLVPSVSSLQAAVTPLLPSGAISIKSLSLALTTLRGTTALIEFPPLNPLIKRGVQLCARALILCRVDPKERYLDWIETVKLPLAVSGVHAPAEHAFYNLERGVTYCVVHVASTKEPSEWIAYKDIAIADGIEFTTPHYVAEMLRVTDVYARSVALEWDGNAPGYIVTVQRMLDAASSDTNGGGIKRRTRRDDDDDEEEDFVSGGLYGVATTYHTTHCSYNVKALLPGSVYRVSVSPSLPTGTEAAGIITQSSMESCEHFIGTVMEPVLKDLDVQAVILDGDIDDDDSPQYSAARRQRVSVTVSYPPFVSMFHDYQLNVDASIEVEGLLPLNGVVTVAPGRVLEVDVKFCVRVSNRLTGVVLLQKDSLLTLNTKIGPFDVLYNATVHHISAEGAEVHWVGTGEHIMMEVVSESDEDRCIAVGQSQPIVPLTDLKPSTEYIVRVKSAQSINFVSTTFRTLPAKPLASTVVVAHSASRRELHVTLPPAVQRSLAGYHHQGTQVIEHQALVWPLDQVIVNKNTDASDTTVLDVGVLSGIHGLQWRTAQGSSFHPLHVEVSQRVTIDDGGRSAAPLESLPAVIAVVTDVYAVVEGDHVTVRWFAPTTLDAASLPAYVSPDRNSGNQLLASHHNSVSRGAGSNTTDSDAQQRRTFHVAVGQQMQTVRGGQLAASFQIPISHDIFQRVVITGPSIAQELSSYYLMLAPPAPALSLFHVTVLEDHAVLELSQRLNSLVSEFIPQDLGEFVELSIDITSACFPPIRIPLPVNETLRVRVPLMLNRFHSSTVEVRTVMRVLTPNAPSMMAGDGGGVDSATTPASHLVDAATSGQPIVGIAADRTPGDIAADAPIFLNRLAASPNVSLPTPMVHAITDIEVVELRPDRCVVKWFSNNSAHDVTVSSGQGHQISCRAVQPFVSLNALEPETCYKVEVRGKESGGHRGCVYFVTPPLLTTMFVSEVVQTVMVNGNNISFDLPQTRSVATRVDGGEGTITTTTHVQLQFPASSAPAEPVVWTSTEASSTVCKSVLPRSVRPGERWPYLSLDSVSECVAGEAIGKIVSLTSHTQDRQAHRIDLVGGVKLEDINSERCVISWMGSASSYLFSYRKPAVDLDDTPDLQDGVGGLLTKPTVVRKNACRHVLDFGTGDSGSIFFISLQGDDGPSNTVHFSVIVPPLAHHCSVRHYTPSTITVSLPRARKNAFLVTGCYVMVNEVKHPHSNGSDEDEVFHVPLDVARTIIRPGAMPSSSSGASQKATHGCLLTVVHHAEPRPVLVNTAEKLSNAGGAPSEKDISSLLVSHPALNSRSETTTTKSMPKLHALADPTLRRVDATSAEVSWTSHDTEFYVEIVQYMPGGLPPRGDEEGNLSEHGGVFIAPALRRQGLDDLSEIERHDQTAASDDRDDSRHGALVQHSGVEEVPFVSRNVITASSHINLRTLHSGALHTVRVRGRNCGDVMIELHFLTQPLFADRSVILRRHSAGNTFTLLVRDATNVVRCGGLTLVDETTVELVDLTPPQLRRQQRQFATEQQQKQHRAESSSAADDEGTAPQGNKHGDSDDRRRNRPPRPLSSQQQTTRTSQPTATQEHDDRRGRGHSDDDDDDAADEPLVEQLRVPPGDDGLEFTVHASLTVIKVIRTLSCDWVRHRVENNCLRTELVVAKVPLVATISHLQLSKVEPNQCMLQWISSRSAAAAAGSAGSSKFTVVATPIASFQSVTSAVPVPTPTDHSAGAPLLLTTNSATNNLPQSRAASPPPGVGQQPPQQQQQQRYGPPPAAPPAALVTTTGNASVAALPPKRTVSTSRSEALVASLAPSTLYEMKVSEDCSYAMTTNRTTRALIVYDDAPETPTLTSYMLTQPRKGTGGIMKRYIGGLTISIDPTCAYDAASGLMMYYAARSIPDNVIVTAVAPCRTDAVSIPIPSLPVSSAKPVFITAVPSINSEVIHNDPHHQHHNGGGSSGQHQPAPASFYTTDINVVEPAGRLTHRVEWFQVVEVHDRSPYRVNTINPLQFSEAEVQPVELVRVIQRPQLSHVTSKRATIQWSTSHEEMRCEVAVSNLLLSQPSSAGGPPLSATAAPAIYRVVESEISLDNLISGSAYEITITPSYHNSTCEALSFVMVTAPRKPRAPDIHALLLNAVFDLLPTSRASHFTVAQPGVAVSLTTTYTALVICDKEVDINHCVTATDYLEKTQARNVFKSSDTSQRIDLRLRSGRSYVFVFFASVHHPMAVNGILHSKPCVVPHRTDCYAPSNLHVIARTKSSITVGWSSVDVGSRLLRFVVEMAAIRERVSAPVESHGAENHQQVAGHNEKQQRHQQGAGAMSVTMQQIFGGPAAAESAGIPFSQAPLSQRSGKFKSLGLRQQMVSNATNGTTAPSEAVNSLTPLQRLQMAFEDDDDAYDGQQQQGGTTELTRQQQVIETSASKPEMHATFSFLTCGVQYAFRVRQVPTSANETDARHAAQAVGPTSAWSTILLTETASPPKPVDRLQVVGVTSSSIRLAWIDRQATDADHIAYIVECKSTERSATNSAVSAKKIQDMKVHTCQCEVVNLLPGSTYRVTVTPVNASGEACSANNAAVMVRTEAPQNWKI
jgi:hypothetical protein